MHYASLPARGGGGPEGLGGGSLRESPVGAAVGISVAVAIAVSVVGALIDQSYDTDERDKQIARKGNAFGGHVLFAGLAVGIAYVFYEGFFGEAESISLVHVAHSLMAAGAVASLSSVLVKIGSDVKGH